MLELRKGPKPLLAFGGGGVGGRGRECMGIMGDAGILQASVEGEVNPNFCRFRMELDQYKKTGLLVSSLCRFRMELGCGTRSGA